MEENFNVKTNVFEGPLELLLSLIEKRKLLVNDISLASVADDYVAHINNLEEFPVSDAANFLLIASTLVLIKSKSLLPTIELSDSEEFGIEELEKRIRLYERIKALSIHVKKHFGLHPMYSPEERPSNEIVFAPHEKMTIENLKTFMFALLKRLPKEVPTPKVLVEKIMNLDNMIIDLTARIQSNIKMSFLEFSKNDGSSREKKMNIAVSFLAMLELVKQGIVRVQQEKMFDDIVMETDSPSVPNYS
jgi:segregation and condensation protein A